jgi:hypothetical protein
MYVISMLALLSISGATAAITSSSLASNRSPTDLAALAASGVHPSALLQKTAPLSPSPNSAVAGRGFSAGAGGASPPAFVAGVGGAPTAGSELA